MVPGPAMSWALGAARLTAPTVLLLIFQTCTVSCGQRKHWLPASQSSLWAPSRMSSLTLLVVWGPRLAIRRRRWSSTGQGHSWVSALRVAVDGATASAPSAPRHVSHRLRNEPHPKRVRGLCCVAVAMLRCQRDGSGRLYRVLPGQTTTYSSAQHWSHHAVYGCTISQGRELFHMCSKAQIGLTELACMQRPST